jgi:hypothetical protein
MTITEILGKLIQGEFQPGQIVSDEGMTFDIGADNSITINIGEESRRFTLPAWIRCTPGTDRPG